MCIILFSIDTNNNYSQRCIWEVAVSKLPWRTWWKKTQPPDHLGSTFHDYKGPLLYGINGCCRCKLETCLCECLGARAGVQMAVSFKAQTFTEPWTEAFLTFLHQNPLPNLKTVMPHMFVRDEAFSLWLDLQKPFLTELDHDQTVYNYHLSRAWQVTENAFGVLANRFRVFRTTICLDPYQVVTITLASRVSRDYSRFSTSVFAWRAGGAQPHQRALLCKRWLWAVKQ